MNRAGAARHRRGVAAPTERLNIAESSRKLVLHHGGFTHPSKATPPKCGSADPGAMGADRP